MNGERGLRIHDRRRLGADGAASARSKFIRATSVIGSGRVGRHSLGIENRREMEGYSGTSPERNDLLETLEGLGG